MYRLVNPREFIGMDELQGGSADELLGVAALGGRWYKYIHLAWKLEIGESKPESDMG